MLIHQHIYINILCLKHVFFIFIVFLILTVIHKLYSIDFLKFIFATLVPNGNYQFSLGQ